MRVNTILQSKRVKEHFIEMPLEIHGYDIDVAGHVNNIVYVRWLEDLRTKLIASISNFRELFENNFYPVVISTEIKYRKQLKIFDNPTGLIEIAGHKHGVITLKSVIKLNDEISASALQRCVFMNMKTSKMINDKLIQELLTHGSITVMRETEL